MRACVRLSTRLFLTVSLLGLLPRALRAQESHPTVAPREQKLLFVGDIMLSRTVNARMKALGDWTYPFEKIAPTLRSADLAFGNLECPVSDTGSNQHHLYSFRADPKALAGLTFAGFKVLSVANNHTFDWGRPALADTLARLHAAGIRPVGAGSNDLEAHYPVLVNLRGVRLAFLAYVNVPPREATAGTDQPGVAWLVPERALADIRFARSLADVVIVSVHWGVEYICRPERRQVEMAHQMIDAGADLVVGGHPHVVQPLEEYHGHWIAYSLGNFIFDQNDPPTHHGLMLEVALSGKQIASVCPVPITIDRSLQAVLTPVAKPASKPQLARKSETASTQMARPRVPGNFLCDRNLRLEPLK
jgi:poly-gamma-glutamate capsule biosynthesis protein CapA/YwtB (metallophosphatase superfamily)